jgi:hypothetical protein
MKLRMSLALLGFAMLAAAALYQRTGLAQVAVAESSVDAAPTTAETTQLAEPADDAALGLRDAPAQAAPAVTTAADPSPDPFAAVFTVQRREPSLQEAAAAVHHAKDDEARSAASERLQQLLHRTFDADMQRREQELARIEQRLQTLREQHARRQEKKDEIIELQTRVLLNEAEGLGFHSSAGPFSDAIGERGPLAVSQDNVFLNALPMSRPAQSSDYLRPATIVPGQAPASSVPRPGAETAPVQR